MLPLITKEIIKMDLMSVCLLLRKINPHRIYEDTVITFIPRSTMTKVVVLVWVLFMGLVDVFRIICI